MVSTIESAPKISLTVSGGNGLISDLIVILLTLPASRLLRSPDGRSTLVGELAMLLARVQSNQQDLQTVVPLLTKVVERAPDAEIWVAVYDLVTKSAPQPTTLGKWTPLGELTPPVTSESSAEWTALTTPRKSRLRRGFTTPSKSIAENAQPSNQTPTVHNTSGIVNSSEARMYFDQELKKELGTSLYIGVPGFTDAFFGAVPNLQSTSQAVFEACQKGRDPLFKKQAGGWQGWPRDAKEDNVLDWFQAIIRRFLKLAKSSSPQKRILRQPNTPLANSVSRRKLDIGFVRNPRTLGRSQFDWSQILIPGELKSNPTEDTHQSTWLDLARYAREVFKAQDSRRFVQGFTLCGSPMRLWEFDRLGGVASSAFDINQDGLSFVSAVLGYLWMTDEQLGFDPTITSQDGKRYITITKGGQTERLVIVNVIKPYYSIIGRGTICWKACREGDESKTLVVKDSWQYPERDEEGQYLLEASKSGVVNVARYYHHETVCVGGQDDTMVDNVRKGLDIGGAENAYKVIARMRTEEERKKKKDDDLVRSMTQLKIQKARTSTTNASLSSLRMPAIAPTTPQNTDSPTRDRIHRRVILQDCGRPLYRANSRVALLAALEGAITGMWMWYSGASSAITWR